METTNKAQGAEWVDQMMDELSKELLGPGATRKLSDARFQALSGTWSTPLAPREMARITRRASELLTALSNKKPCPTAAIHQLSQLVKQLRFRPLDLAEHARRRAAKARRVLGGPRRQLLQPPKSDAPTAKWWAVR
jgi:hypothetical protein